MTAARLPAAPVLFGLARLQYPPGASGSSQMGLGPLLVAVEAGALTVAPRGEAEVVRADGTKTAVAARATLRPGDRLLLAAGGQFAVRNDGSVPALVVAAGLFPVGNLAVVAPRQFAAGPISPQWADAWSPGAMIQAFAGGWLIAPPTRPAMLTLSRLSLPPGARVALPPTSGRALGIEAGALTLTLGGGLAWVQTPNGDGRPSDQAAAPAAPPADGALVQAGAATLLPGDGALLQNATNVTLDNDGDGPLLVLVLTVGPAGNDATPIGA
jgi:hypothetical protein